MIRGRWALEDTAECPGCVFDLGVGEIASGLVGVGSI